MGLKYKHKQWHLKKKQKQIDQDIVIKMFDHLKGRVHMGYKTFRKGKMNYFFIFGI